ncbi:MAG: hypothetical protein ACLGIA_04785 [Actinomycetes bacterium]
MPPSAGVCEGQDMQGRRAASTRHRAEPRRGAAEAAPDSVRAQWPVLLLVVLLLVGLAVLVSAAGPAQFGEPRLVGVPGFDRPLHQTHGAPPAGVPALTRHVDPALPGWTTVVWMLGVCMLVALVVRSAARLLRAAREQEDTRPDAVPPDAVRDAALGPLLQGGVRDATRALEASAG